MENVRSDTQVETVDVDGKADAFAAIAAITIVITTLVFWITNQ